MTLKGSHTIHITNPTQINPSNSSNLHAQTHLQTYPQSCHADFVEASQNQIVIRKSQIANLLNLRSHLHNSQKKIPTSISKSWDFLYKFFWSYIKFIIASGKIPISTNKTVATIPTI